MKIVEPVDYTSTLVPSAYRCDGCGATSCKLWRSQAVIPYYWCVDCAAVRAGIFDEVDAEGERPDEHGGKTTQIGPYIPALLTEEGDAHSHCTSAPEEAWQWWKGLPTRAAA